MIPKIAQRTYQWRVQTPPCPNALAHAATSRLPCLQRQDTRHVAAPFVPHPDARLSFLLRPSASCRSSRAWTRLHIITACPRGMVFRAPVPLRVQCRALPACSMAGLLKRIRWWYYIAICHACTHHPVRLAHRPARLSRPALYTYRST